MYYLYIDESEDSDRFAVGGLITTDDKELLDSIYDTRKYIKKAKGIPEKQKQKILNELKDHYFTKNLLHIKTHLLKNLVHNKDKKNGSYSEKIKENIKFICAYYKKKKNEDFNQQRKEEIYLKCFLKVLEEANNIQKEMVVIYDNLGYSITYDEIGSDKQMFHEKINTTIREKCSNIVEIGAGKSYAIKQLQAADICIGCLRRHLNNEELDDGNFQIIKKCSKFISVVDYYEYDYLKISNS